MTALFYKKNRHTVAKLTHEPLLVIPGHDEVQSKSDMAHPLRQDSNFFYLTGCEQPGLVLVIDKERKVEFLILPDRPKHRDVWDGAIDLRELRKQSGITDIKSFHEGTDYLARRLGIGGAVGMPLPAEQYLRTYGFFTNPSRQFWYDWLKNQQSTVCVNDIRSVLARMRQKKTTKEIENIKRAIAMTEMSLDELLTSKLSGRTEKEVRAQLEYLFVKHGASGTGFDSVIASGSSTATVHHRQNNQIIPDNSLFLADIGAEYYGYSADITRTFYLGRRPSNRLKDVYRAVYAIQKQAIDYLKTGVMFRDYESHVKRAYERELKKLGLITHKSQAQDYIVHATSHFLGLDVHDAGDYQSALTEDTVITVEPGLYLKTEGIGIRIEDDVLITKKGVEQLTRPAPNELPRLVY